MELSSERRKKTKKKQNSCYTCEAFSGRVYQKGGSATATKSFGWNSGVRQNLGFTEKNFASLFEYSTVVPGCHALALAALCMDVVMEAQDLK